MRQRLNPEHRRADILKHAVSLFHEKGFAATEMEDIRLACGISRGGLYHHFASKTAILSAIVKQETEALLPVLQGTAGNPMVALVQAGSQHLGNGAGILETLATDDGKLAYLGYLDQAQAQILRPALVAAMQGGVRAGVDPAHVVELFLTVNALINRRAIMGEWSAAENVGFAALALETLAPLVADEAAIRQLAAALRAGAGA